MCLLRVIRSWHRSSHDYRAASSKIDLQLYLDVYSSWQEQALTVKNATGANQTFTIQPVTTSLVEQGILKGGNPLGIPSENFQCDLAPYLLLSTFYKNSLFL